MPRPSHKRLNADVERLVNELARRLVKDEMPFWEAHRLLYKRTLERAFRVFHGNLSQISRSLGIARPTLYRFQKRFGKFR
jgi:transcriptional regulator of acetoin/glycerol metabolism